jgi:predicted permease
MKHVWRVWHRLLGSFTGARKDDDLARELDAHVQLMTDDLVARGVDRADARRQALLAFGGVEQTKERYRDQRGLPWLDAFRQDTVFGWRTWRRNPAFAAIAVLSLAVGLAANTTVFGALNGLLVKPLPVREPQTLRVLQWVGNSVPVSISGRLDQQANGWTVADAFSADAYRQFRDRSPDLTDVVAISGLPRLAVIARGEAAAARGVLVSGNFFSALGVAPRAGRTFAPPDDGPGAEPVVVVSYDYWHDRLGGDATLVGRSVLVNGTAFTLIGVLPPAFRGVYGNAATDLYVPLSAQPQLRPRTPWDAADSWTLQILARIRPGADERRAAATAAALFNATVPPEASGETGKRGPRAILLSDGSRGLQYSVRGPIPVLLMLAGTAGIVLLVACANVAGLQLLKGAARRQELAIRVALGAGRWRLARHVLTESLLLALVAGVVGLLLATWSTALMARLIWPAETALDLAADYRVFGFLLALSVVSALLAGLLPAIRAARMAPAAGLARRSARATARLGVGRVLVSVQVGLSLVLLIGAGLFTRTLVNLYRVDTGFDPASVLTFSLDASTAGYKGQAVAEVYDRVLAGVEKLPGVLSASHSGFAMLSGWRTTTVAALPGQGAGRAPMQVLGLAVSDGFFDTMRLPRRRGRAFSVSDSEKAPRVFAVNDTFVKRAFPHEDPMGKTVRLPEGEGQIVAVVGDMTYVGLREPVEPTVFYPSRQQRRLARVVFEMRTAVPPMTLLPAVRRVVAGVDGRLPVSDAKTQAAQLAESIRLERGLTSLAVGLALVAILLSCIGLYGLISYHVARRTGEIGIRMALGSTAWGIVWPILRGAVLMVTAGVALGLPAAFAMSRVLREYLFGIEPMDRVTLAAAVLLLLVAALAGAFGPARRAARVDPAVALRCE